MTTQIKIELERYEFNEGLPYHFEPDRREFFKLAGAGIAVFLVARVHPRRNIARTVLENDVVENVS